MRDGQPPKRQRPHLNELPARGAQLAQCEIARGGGKQEGENQGEDANGIAKSKAALEHHISLQLWMEFKTEQPHQVKFDPSHKDDDAMNKRQYERVDAQFTTVWNKTHRAAKNPRQRSDAET